jgi:chromosome segregation ATPase
MSDPASAAEIARLTAALKKAQDRHALIKTEFEKLADNNRTLTATIEQRDSLIIQLTQDRDRRLVLLEEQRESVKLKDQLLADKETELQEKTALNASIVQAFNQERMELAHKLEAAEQRIRDLESKIGEAPSFSPPTSEANGETVSKSDDILNLTFENGSLKTRIQALSEENSQLSAQLDELGNILTQTESENHQLKEKLATATAAFAGTPEQTNELDRAKEESAAAVEDLRARLQEAESRNAKLAEAKQQLQTELDRVTAQSQQNDELSRALTERAKAIEAQDAELQKSRAVLAQEKEALEKEKQEHFEAQTVLDEKIVQFRNQVQLLNQETESFNQQKQELKKQKRDFAKESKQFKQQQHEFQAEKDRFLQEKGNLESTNAVLRREFEEIKETLARETERASSTRPLDIGHSDCQIKIDEQKATIEQLEEEISRLKTETAAQVESPGLFHVPHDSTRRTDRATGEAESFTNDAARRRLICDSLSFQPLRPTAPLRDSSHLQSINEAYNDSTRDGIIGMRCYFRYSGGDCMESREWENHNQQSCGCRCLSVLSASIDATAKGEFASI